MPIALVVPDYRDEGSEARVCSWLLQVGDPVQLGQPVVELLTEKASIEVTAPCAGVLESIAVEVNEGVHPGQELGRISGEAPAQSLRRVVAQRIERRMHEVPHVTAAIEADWDAVVDARASRRRNGAVSIPSLTAYAMRAASLALQEVPVIAGYWEHGQRIPYSMHNLAIVVDLDGDGLVAPVLNNAARMKVEKLQEALGDLVTRARENRLASSEVRGATLTLSNHGMQGTIFAAPIVIGPRQIAALGLGAVRQIPVVNADGLISVGYRGYVTLTVDHRALDGHHASAYLSAYQRSLKAVAQE